MTMQVAISGASGLVGSALSEALRERGRRVRPMVRRAARSEDEIGWDPAAGRLDPEDLRGVDAVVHLAGESIASGRWTEERKARILASRVDGTRLVAEALARLEEPPPTLVCASAIGYYGDRGDEVLDEGSPPGEGFLAEVCRRWEAAADPARERGLRVVHLRLGMVLSAAGGALERMLPVFRLGLGGRLGDGRQWMSWIARDDLVEAVLYLLGPDGADLAGAVNATAPEPVTNRRFTEALGDALGRPTLVPAPAAAIRLALGEMGEELLLASARVVPARLLETGFEFRFPQVGAALRHVLDRKRRGRADS